VVANLDNRTELLLRHRHVGIDLRQDWATEVLENFVRIWKRPVRLDTVLGGKAVRLGHDGDKPSIDGLKEDGPKDAEKTEEKKV